MTQRISDHIKETWTGTGTGAMTLAGAATGYRTFGSQYADGDTVFYVIENPGTGEYEGGEGTLASSGASLQRTTQIYSSNGGALVNFTAGIKNVFCTPHAIRLATKSGQLTTGSIPFIDSRGQLIEDNASLFFTDSTNTLSTVNLIATTKSLVGSSTEDGTFDGGAINPALQIHAISNATAYAAIYRWQNAAGGPRWGTGKSRGATVGTRGVVQSGDSLGNFLFEGDDGTNFIIGAGISAEVDGTPGTNDMPGRLIFSTTADGAATLTEAMRINNAQQLLIGTTTAISGSKVAVGGVITALSATAIGAGAATQAFIKGSSTADFGLYYGSGAPSFTAAKSSLYLNTTAVTTTTRAYVNTTGSNVWAFITTSA